MTLFCITTLSSLLFSISLIEKSLKQSSDLKLKNYQAKRNAKIALALAIEKLQWTTGSDRIITTNTGIIDKKQLPLSATAWDPITQKWIELQCAENEDKRKITLLSHRHISESYNEIDIPIQKTENHFKPVCNNNYAYWIADEGCKASLLVETKASKESQRQIRSQIDLTSLHDSLSSLSLDQNKLCTRRQFSLKIAKSSDLSNEEINTVCKEIYPNINTCNYAPIASSKYKQLKTNWTNLLNNELQALKKDNEAVFDFFDTGVQLNTNPYIPFKNSNIATNTEIQPYTHLAPVITEFFLYMGVFHTQSDNYLRLRYHIAIELWNPYPFPLILKEKGGSKSKSYILLINNLPTLRIQNKNKPAMECIVDLNNFEKFIDVRETINNSPSKKQLHAWIEIKDQQNKNFSGVLLPGETLHIIEPQNNKNGLSRLLNSHADRWYLDNQNYPNKSFDSQDSFKIFSTEDTQIQLKLLPYKSPGISKAQDPSDYEKENPAIIEIRNIPFKQINYTIPATSEALSFSIPKSSDYKIDQYNFGSYFRLKSQLLSEEKILFHNFDPRQASIDFTIKEHFEAFEIIEDPVEAFYLKESCFQSIEDDFHSQTSNQRNYYHSPSSGYIPQYSAAIAFEFPTKTSHNVSIFKNLLHKEQSSSAMGRALIKASHLNQLYENSYFSGSEQSELNPRLHFIKDPDNIPKVENTLIKGSFNLHSCSIKAWETILREAQDATKMESQNSFYKFPNCAEEIQQINEKNTNRKELKTLQKSYFELSEEVIYGLAKNIVQRLREKVKNTGPYSSIEEFINNEIEPNKNLLDCAISDTRQTHPNMDKEFHAGTILNSISTFLTVRSDTFSIRSYGEAYNPYTQKTEAKAWCQATVQRFPEYIDPEDAAVKNINICNERNKTLGRRYKIIKFEWLRHDEI